MASAGRERGAYTNGVVTTLSFPFQPNVPKTLLTWTNVVPLLKSEDLAFETTAVTEYSIMA